MKLRNKKTGEIVEVESLYLTQTQELYLNYINEENKQKVYMTNKIASFNLDWEDYEEPKESEYYWYIGYKNDIRRTKYHHTSEFADNQVTETRKAIGNYFDTREEAEKAIEKLKAWKRLKDKGFRFEYYDYSDRDLHNHIQIKAITNREVEDSMLYKEDLDLLFGGEE